MPRLVVLSVPAMLLTMAAPDWAYSRNCTVQEKESANARLLEIEDSPILQASLVKRHAPWGVHRSTGSVAGERVLHQDGYILSHDSDLRTALWVAYRLSRAEVEAGEGKDRVNCFRKDPRMTKAETATTTDYNEARFDQGHMANDRDMKDVLREQVNTYIMSNMSPQDDCFNRGIWLSLEHQVRRWARAYGEVYVTSGASFDRNGDGVRDADEEAERMKSRNEGVSAARLDILQGLTCLRFSAPYTAAYARLRPVDQLTAPPGKANQCKLAAHPRTKSPVYPQGQLCRGHSSPTVSKSGDEVSHHQVGQGAVGEVDLVVTIGEIRMHPPGEPVQYEASQQGAAEHPGAVDEGGGSDVLRPEAG